MRSAEIGGHKGAMFFRASKSRGLLSSNTSKPRGLTKYNRWNFLS